MAPAPLKTSSSAGVPGFVESYLYAKRVIPRKRAIQTEEVADVAAFPQPPLQRDQRPTDRHRRRNVDQLLRRRADPRRLARGIEVQAKGD